MMKLFSRERMMKAVFALYGLALLWVTVIRNLGYALGQLDMGRNLLSHIRYNTNLVPLESYKLYYDRLMAENINVDIVVNIVCGNLLVLIPLGILCAVCWKMSFGRMLTVSFAAAAVLDLLQLLTMTGSFDVDVILLRAVGACVGYAAAMLAMGMLRLIRSAVPKPA